jgi:hypothetical protein
MIREAMAMAHQGGVFSAESIIPLVLARNPELQPATAIEGLRRAIRAALARGRLQVRNGFLWPGDGGRAKEGEQLLPRPCDLAGGNVKLRSLLCDTESEGQALALVVGAGPSWRVGGLWLKGGAGREAWAGLAGAAARGRVERLRTSGAVLARGSREHLRAVWRSTALNWTVDRELVVRQGREEEGWAELEAILAATEAGGAAMGEAGPAEMVPYVYQARRTQG